MQTESTDRRDQEVVELLQAYPAPEAAPGFFDRALVRATHEGSRRQRNRWMLTGFGAAVAATAALWVVAALLFATPELPAPDASIPGVSVALEQPRTVNLVFASAAPLAAATLTVTLPDGIELDGFPGQREITWETSLTAGRNLLPLTLVALTPAGGELLATLEHEDRNRTFRLHVTVNKDRLDGTSG